MAMSETPYKLVLVGMFTCLFGWLILTHIPIHPKWITPESGPDWDPGDFTANCFQGSLPFTTYGLFRIPGSIVPPIRQPQRMSSDFPGCNWGLFAAGLRFTPRKCVPGTGSPTVVRNLTFKWSTDIPMVDNSWKSGENPNRCLKYKKPLKNHQLSRDIARHDTPGPLGMFSGPKDGAFASSHSPSEANHILTIHSCHGMLGTKIVCHINQAKLGAA